MRASGIGTARSAPSTYRWAAVDTMNRVVPIAECASHSIDQMPVGIGVANDSAREVRAASVALGAIQSSRSSAASGVVVPSGGLSGWASAPPPKTTATHTTVHVFLRTRAPSVN